jgi:hypothetical protein
MKRFQNTASSLFRPNQDPAGVATSSAGASTVRLSENAFYLIALATLLRPQVGNKRLQEILVPGRFVGYGDPSSAY